MYLEKFKQIVDASGQDETAKKLVLDVLRAAIAYIDAVYAFESQIVVNGSSEDLSPHFELQMSAATDALISSIKQCNRYIFRTIPDLLHPGGIYSGDPADITNADRQAICSWAGALLAEMFASRRCL